VPLHLRTGSLLLAALLLPALPRAAEPIVIRFSHVVSADAPKGQAAEFFRRRAEALTGGRVRVEVFPDGTLYKDHEELEALLLGSVQLLAPSLSKLGALGVHEFEAFDLPFLFDGYEALRKVTDGPVGQGLLRKLEPKGIMGLSFWDNGFKSFSARTPVHGPEDLKGLRMRIQPSGVLDAQMRALGAYPQVIPFPEVRRALASGVVDGTENPISNFYTQKMHEVQPHLCLSRHGYLGYAVIANRRFWDGLPGEVREQLVQAIREATEVANRLARQRDEEDLEAVRRSGRTLVYLPTPAERLRFQRALTPLHRAMEGRVGPSTIQAIHRATGFDPIRP
jgi:C4-dicarboxylate-binding protein DctP